MERIGLEVLIIFVLLLINGLFSMSEIALVTANKVRLKKESDKQNRGAIAAMKIVDSPDTFLSTVQIGITLVGVLSGAFGGAALAVHLAPFFSAFPAIEPYSEPLSFGMVVLVITYFSLVIGELVPKRIALNSPEMIATLVSRPMNLISQLTAPVVWLLSASTRVTLKILRISDRKTEAVTEEEVRAMIVQGANSGILEEAEQELMESVIRLDEQNITALMTPRSKIGFVDRRDTTAEICRKIEDCKFSRLLVVDGDLDNTLGFVKAKDILNQLLASKPLELEKVVKQPIFIPETVTGLEVLKRFRESNTHMAVIIDEFGSTHGLVTTNDILEAIVGDLAVSGIRTESVVVRDDSSWLLDARLSNAEFCEVLGIAELPEEESGMYETLAGFIIKRLEHLPSTGEKFDWNNITFEVVDMDGKRIDRVLASRRS